MAIWNFQVSLGMTSAANQADKCGLVGTETATSAKVGSESGEDPSRNSRPGGSKSPTRPRVRGGGICSTDASAGETLDHGTRLRSPRPDDLLLPRHITAMMWD
jgi:hypothetical protein